METASIAGGATVAALLVVALCAAAYVRVRRRSKGARSDGADCVDGLGPVIRSHQPTFGRRHAAGDCTQQPKLHHVTTLLPPQHTPGDA